MSNKVLMTVSNACNPDPRVLMEANLLRDLGYDVEILCWDRTGEVEDSEINGIKLTRVRILSSYGKGMSQINQMLGFWKKIVQKINKGNYNIIHAHDFDTLIPTYYASKKNNIPIIFDAHEIYADMIEFHVPKIISNTVRFIERRISNRVDNIITVGERMRNFYLQDNSQTYIVGNYKEMVDDQVVESQKEKIRKALSIPLNAKVIGYIGVFGKDRVIQPLMRAVQKTNENIYLIIGGRGTQEEEIVSIANQTNKIKFLGFVNSESINEYLSAVDYIYYGLNSEFNNNYYSTPNSLFNAIALGKPVVIGDIGEISEITRKKELGHILDNLNEESFIRLFKMLTVDNKYELFVSNIKSARKIYSLNGNKETLLEIYSRLNNRSDKNE
ncbi:glycosyltransferase [Lysinibacillus telephonicus]|uniref:glycosyltransferase n=1 Tax=Lysinibacillus telephonicus TaxID=1714840 RepID=UPI003B9DCB90